MSAERGGDAAFERLLEYLSRTRGFDFAAYKRSSLARRTERRMHALGLSDYDDYIDRLEVDPDEFDALFNTLLINVTSFFRDAEAWAYLEDPLLGRLIAGKPDGEPIRVWSAGCASGEEAYSIAMLLAEQLGLANTHRVKIYATDVDAEALALARQGTYDHVHVEAVRRACANDSSNARASATPSTPSCGAPSSSAATTWSRIHPSPGWTSSSAATP